MDAYYYIWILRVPFWVAKILPLFTFGLTLVWVRLWAEKRYGAARARILTLFLVTMPAAWKLLEFEDDTVGFLAATIAATQLIGYADDGRFWRVGLAAPYTALALLVWRGAAYLAFVWAAAVPALLPFAIGFLLWKYGYRAALPHFAIAENVPGILAMVDVLALPIFLLLRPRDNRVVWGWAIATTLLGILNRKYWLYATVPLAILGSGLTRRVLREWLPVTLAATVAFFLVMPPVLPHIPALEYLRQNYAGATVLAVWDMGHFLHAYGLNPIYDNAHPDPKSITCTYHTPCELNWDILYVYTDWGKGFGLDVNAPCATVVYDDGEVRIYQRMRSPARS